MRIDDSCPLACKWHRESKGERRYIYAISFLVKDQALIKGGFFLPDLEPLSLTTKAMYCRRQEVVVVVPNMELINQQQRSFAQFMTSRRKNVFDPNFRPYRAGHHTADRQSAGFEIVASMAR